MNCFVNIFVNVQADPFIEVKLGQTKVDTCDEYVPNTLNPVFGKWVVADCFMQLVLAFLQNWRLWRIGDFLHNESGEALGEVLSDVNSKASIRG